MKVRYLNDGYKDRIFFTAENEKERETLEEIVYGFKDNYIDSMDAKLEGYDVSANFRNKKNSATLIMEAQRSREYS